MRPPGGKDIEDFSRDVFAHVNLARQNFADGFQHPLAALLLHQVAAGPGAQGPLRVQHFVVHRNNQHGQARLQRLKVFDQLQAALSPAAPYLRPDTAGWGPRDPTFGLDLLQAQEFVAVEHSPAEHG